MDNSDSKIPKKGILKSSSSFDKQEKPQRRNRNAKWDEMNIMATFHPADKDYGHMKVEEPKTPYNWELMEDADVDSALGPIDPNVLAAKLSEEASTSRRRSTPSISQSESESDEEDVNLTEEERARKREFTNRRKKHYNEFKAVQLARKLMQEEEEEDDESHPETGDAV